MPDGSGSARRSGVKRVTVKDRPENGDARVIATPTIPACGAPDSCGFDGAVTIKPYEMKPGRHTISVEVEDNAGNVAPKSFDVTVDWRTGRLDNYQLGGQALNDRSELGVNLANGNLVLSADDLEIGGLGIDLQVARSYNSLGSSDALARRPLGYGWTVDPTGDTRISRQDSGDVIFYGPTGIVARFAKKSSGDSYDSPRGIPAELTGPDSGGDYTLTFDDSRLKFRFNSAGRLTQQVDRNDREIVYSYQPDGRTSSIRDTRNRNVSFDYDGKGRLTKMTDWAGREWRYAYDPASGELSSYTDPGGKTTT